MPAGTAPERTPGLSRRSVSLVCFAPSAIGLGGVVLALGLGLSMEATLPLLSAVVALQSGAALIAGSEVRRLLRQARAAREAGAARQAAAQETERSRVRVLATAAHELRTPLNGIAGLLEAVVAAPGLPPAARADAAAALEAARDLSQALGDLGEMPDGAQPPLASLPFRVDEAMEGVVTLLSGRAHGAGIRLATAVAPGTPALWRGDAARLRQILTALVAQALRSTERGEIRVEARETAAGALELGVSDTGRGIPADRLDRIFEPFAWPEGGAGLRLARCRDLARRMGGTIAVQSAPGRGSVFTVTLPLPRAEAAEPTPAMPAPAMPASPARPAAPVLVVDDVAVNRRLLVAMLGRAGFAAEEAGDGAAAVRMAAARPYLAVLMDVEMPGMDGLEATRRLRALPGDAGRLPVIAVTAHRSADGEAAARAAGMDSYLVKPVSAAELAETLGRAATPAEA